MGKVVKLLGMLRPGHVRENALTLCFNAFLSCLALVQLPSQLLHAAAVVVAAQTLKVSFNVHGIQLVHAGHFPEDLPESGILPLLTHALQLTGNTLGKVVHHHILYAAQHHILVLYNKQRLFQDLTQFTGLVCGQGGKVPVLVGLQVSVQSGNVGFLLRGVLFQPLFGILDLAPQLLHLNFPGLVHIVQPVADLLRQPTLLPFHGGTVSQLHLPVNAPAQAFHSLPYVPPFWHRAVCTVQFCPQLCRRLAVANGIVGQSSHGPNLFQQVFRYIAFFAWLFQHLGQLACHLIDIPPGGVHLPGIPGLLQLFFRPVFRQPNGGAHAFPLLPGKGFRLVCPGVGFGSFQPERVSRAFGSFFQLLFPLCSFQFHLRPRFQRLLLCLLAHLLPLLRELLPGLGVLLVGHLGAVHVPQHDLHGNVLLCPVPVLAVIILHHRADCVMGLCHGFQRFHGAIGRFGGEQPRPQLLQLGKVCVPMAVHSFFALGDLHAAPGQLLACVGPAAPVVQDLAVVLRSLFDHHAHLVQLRVVLPHFVVLMAAPLHQLFGNVRGKGVHIVPAHILIQGNVVTQGPHSLCKGLGIQLTARVAQHGPHNVGNALVGEAHLPAQFAHLSHQVGLLVHVTQGGSAGCFCSVAVHVQLVFRLRLYFCKWHTFHLDVLPMIGYTTHRTIALQFARHLEA